MRRLRYSLRTLLMMFVVVAGVAAWMAWRNAEAHRVAKRFAELANNGQFESAEAMFSDQELVAYYDPLPPSRLSADPNSEQFHGVWEIFDVDQCQCAVAPQSWSDWLHGAVRVSASYSIRGSAVTGGRVLIPEYQATPTGITIAPEHRYAFGLAVPDFLPDPVAEP